MLLFDTAIFSSFIPQLLMLFGYIICLFAHNLTLHTADTSQQHTEKQTISCCQIYTNSIKENDQSKLFSFFDSQNVADETVDSSSLLGFISECKNLHFKPHSFSIESNLFSFLLFSRPPPCIA